MSQPSANQEKSVSFRLLPSVIPQSSNQGQNDFDSGKKVTDKKQAPMLKTGQVSTLDLLTSASDTSKGACSGKSTDPIAPHTTPVIHSRQPSSRAPSSSANDVNKPGALNSPREHNIAADSPRRQKLTPRGSDQPGPAASSKATPRQVATSAKSDSSSSSPREADQEKLSSPRDNRSREFRKKASRKFNDLKLNLTGLSEKVGSSISTSRLSPSSASSISPGRLTPTKKHNNFLKDVPVDIRNKLAKAYWMLKKDSLYVNSGETRRSMMLNAKMIGILSENNIAFDGKKLQALVADAALRSQHAEIDIEIDFTKSPYPDLIHDGSKKFLTRWDSDNSDKGQKFKDLPANERELIDQHFMPTFIADYCRAGVSHELQLSDGSTKEFASPVALAAYLNEGANGESRSRYISNVTLQNIVNLLQQLTCGGLPGTTSPIKLFDGTPLVPRGRVEQRFIYQLEKDNTVTVRVQVMIYADNLGNAKRQSQVQNPTRDPVAIDNDAKLQIESTLRFESSGEWTIYNPHLVASGWNLPESY